MSTTTPLSRIARQLTLRRAELTAHTASVVAWTLTALLVGAGYAEEGNPFSAALISQSSPKVWALVTPLLVGGLFAGLRWVRDNDDPRAALVSGWAVAAALVLDAAGNLLGTAVVGLPTVQVPEFGGFVVGLAGLAALCVLRPSPPTVRAAVPRLPALEHRLRITDWPAVAMALLLIIASTAGVVFIATQAGPGAEHSGTARAASPDGDTIYISSGSTVKALDSDTRDVIWSSNAHSDTVYSVALSPDGETVYTGSDDNTVKALDADTGVENWSTSVDTVKVDSVAPSPDGETVYAASYDNKVTALDSTTGDEIWTSSQSTYVEAVAPSPDGNTVYIGSGDTVKALESDTGDEIWANSAPSEGDVNFVSPSPDGETLYIATGDMVKALDSTTGDEIWNSSAYSSFLTALALSPDGKTVYAADYDGFVKALDSTTGEEIWTSSQSSNVGSVEPSPDGNTVYIGAGDTVKGLDSGTGDEIWTSNQSSSVDSISTGWRYASVDSPRLNGTVTNQAGDPVANATVVGWGVDYSNISTSKAQSLEDRARELVQESSNVRPDAFKPELQLTGGDGKLRSASEPYVAVHTRGDWNIRTSGDEPAQDVNPDLGQPMVQAPANEELVFSAWNPENDPLVQDSTDGDLPGSTIPENQTIVVEQIGPSNSTIKEPLRLETEPVLEYGTLSFSGKTHYAATTELPTGFYRVRVENSSFSYVIAVGDTKQMVQSIQADLNASATQYSNRAQEVREKVDQGKFTKYRTTTNENGSFNFSTGSNVKTVAIQAHKAPPGIDDPANASLEDIRTYYATTDYNGSVVLPSNVETVDAPSSNNTVPVREYSAPNYPDLQTFENKTELFNQFLENLSYSELPSQYQQPTVDVTREQWKTSYETLRSLVEGRPEVEERAQELLGSDEELFIDASEATTAEIRQRATVMQQAFAETPNTIETGRLETSTTTDTISARFPFDTDLEPEDVMVTVQYPNGTSEVLNTSSEYVSVESNIGADAVVINDFPVSSDGPASVSFGVKVANEDGVATDRERVDNPAVSGTPPSIESISLSTLRPGPDETVSMQINGGDETTVTNISSATVYAPDGSKLDTTITGQQGIEFTTAGKGVHTMQVTFETSDGQTATVTERITAGTNPKAMPPGVRVSESPLGVYAVTGDGIEAGEVSIENGGSSVTVLAQLNETADIPSTLHVYTSGVSLPPSSDLTVRVVQGDEQQSVSKNVVVSVHLAQLPTDTATIYANGEPLPRDGGNANGEVTTTASGTTVQTLTDANGVLELSTDASPGRIDRLIYRLELDTGFNIPTLTLLPGVPGWAPPAGAGLLVIGVPLAARRSSR